MSPWRSRKARLFPEQQVARSSRAGDTVAHDSPVREAVRKTAEIGFDPRVRLHGLWSNGQDSGLLNRQCAFDSRRAGSAANFRVLTLWTLSACRQTGRTAPRCACWPSAATARANAGARGAHSDSAVIRQVSGVTETTSSTAIA